MKFFKKFGTYFSMLTLVLSGMSFKSIASEGEDETEAFDDPNATEEDESSATSTGTADSGISSGVWVAITGAVLALFSGFQ